MCDRQYEWVLDRLERLHQPIAPLEIHEAQDKEP